MSGPTSAKAQQAIALARAGDFEAALAAAAKALADTPNDAGLQLFVGLLHSRLLQVADAVPHFRRAMELAPGDATARLELVRALVALGELDECELLLDQGGLPPRESDKLRAAVLAQRNAVGPAAEILRRLVAADPRDIESWNQLGNCLLSDGQPGAAASAFNTSLQARPDQPAIWDKWVDSMMASGSGEEALAAVEGTSDPAMALPAARLLDRLDRPDEAIARIEKFAVANPDAVHGMATLADMLERRNRVEELAQIIDRIAAIAPDFERLPLLRAKLALRTKDFAGARKFAIEASPLVDPATRQQLIGESSDRLGDFGAAWEAYAAMNAADSRANVSAQAEAADYLDRLAAETEALDSTWAKAWKPRSAAESLPIILLGFPRSGTTLLDTFLTAHPSLFVSEENPLLPTLSQAAGPVAALPAMAEPRIAELRSLYWATAARLLPQRGVRRLVDKYPFGLVAAPYVERLFAGAPFLFVQRHPCDVVLSCFFTRFQPTGAAAAFASLADSARLYDRMMHFWTRSRDLLGLNALDVRYERMVADTEGEMRAVAAFLGLDWVAGMTENRSAAEGRGLIKTPSYAQVSEPVYNRSVERWRKYRAQMEPILPILEPWAETFGYSL